MRGIGDGVRQFISRAAKTFHGIYSESLAFSHNSAVNPRRALSRDVGLNGLFGSYCRSRCANHVAGDDEAAESNGRF